MSENGYAKPGDVLAKKKVTRYSDATVQGFKFLMKSWSERDMARFNKRDHGDRGNVHMVCETCVSPDTKEPLFTEEQAEELRDTDAGFFVELLNSCMNHIGFDEEAEKN